MKSGWFFGTEMWAEYQRAYFCDHQHVIEWKSSPLANDHDFSDVPDSYEIITRQTQVIDLSYPIATLWQGVRKSYHSIIHRANEQYDIHRDPTIMPFRLLHHEAFGNVRTEQTFMAQSQWMAQGYAMSVSACCDVRKGTQSRAAAAYWIIYKGCAYYASGPAVEKNVQHAVIWKSLELLKARGIQLVEMGQIDGETTKEINIGKFKAGFGGRAVPFQIARRVN